MERMEKGKKGIVLKTLERCRSFSSKNKSSSPRSTEKHRLVPEGYFTVCVGADKDRFMIKTECVNHPLFKLLLNDAATEYGFSREGPLELPCNVDLFDRVLWEMEQEMVDATGWRSFAASPIRCVGKSYGGYRMLSPSRIVLTGSF